MSEQGGNAYEKISYFRVCARVNRRQRRACLASQVIKTHAKRNQRGSHQCRRFEQMG